VIIEYYLTNDNLYENCISSNHSQSPHNKRFTSKVIYNFTQIREKALLQTQVDRLSFDVTLTGTVYLYKGQVVIHMMYRQRGQMMIRIFLNKTGKTTIIFLALIVGICIIGWASFAEWHGLSSIHLLGYDYTFFHYACQVVLHHGPASQLYNLHQWAWLSGIPLGLTVLFKVTPLAIAVYLLLRRQWRNTISTATTLVLFTALTVMVLGVSPLTLYLRKFLSFGQTSMKNGPAPYNQSLIGVLVLPSAS
jgi:hypothetical protein